MQPVRLGAAGAGLFACALLGTLVAPSSRTQTLETSEQTNERIRALAATPHAGAPGDYVIGSGDLISVQVFDVPELSRDLRVSQTGTIGMPLMPVRLHVAGLTEIEAERKIEEALDVNGLVSHAEVSVTVRERKSRPITVVGAVGHPMVYSADRPVTLIEVLAEAGGIVGGAGDQVIITRLERDASANPSDAPAISQEDAAPPSGKDSTPQNAAPSRRTTSESPAASTTATTDSSLPQVPSAARPGVPGGDPPQLSALPASNTISVNLNQILETGDMTSNIVLLPGDVVTVPHAGIVYVLGAVARPGGYTVSNDRAQLSTLKVLSLAGGLNRTAKSDRAVIVRKDSTGQQHEVEVDLRKVMTFQQEDVQLRPSDVLYVPTSAAKQTLLRAGELALAVGTGVLVYRLVR
jgi:protein involved in polysaccharide export with SLBB domain